MNHSMRRAWTMLTVLGCLAAWAPHARGDADRGWYLIGGAGYNHIDSKEGFDINQDPGFRLVAAGGFQFNRIFALELDSGYIRSTFSESTRESSQHPLNQFPVVLGGVFSIPVESRFEPYVGAGLGAVIVKMGEASGGDFCLSFKGGARYGVGEHVQLGADYTFFMLGIASAFLGEAVGDDTFNLSLRWNF